MNEKKNDEQKRRKGQDKEVDPRIPDEARNNGKRRNPVVRPQNWGKARNTAYLFLRGEPMTAIPKMTNIGVGTFHRWRECDWWWNLVEEEADSLWFQELQSQGKRTLFLQTMDQGKDLALKVLERTDDRLAPPKQQIEMNHNFMARDMVVQIFVGLTRDAGELIEDPDKRDEFLRRAEARLLDVDGSQQSGEILIEPPDRDGE